jgi:uncharacterized OB-fold protein
MTTSSPTSSPSPSRYVPTRPLPALTPETEFFWLSGQDGTLRIQQCESCEAHLHPPVPICRYCHSRDTKIVAVSGLGSVVGYTVNHQQWLPAFDPPYVVAIVALDEDSRVRITSNVVGCPPDDVHIGMRVSVCFEQAGNVWLPLFAPTGQSDVQLPEDPPYATVRPMVSMEKFEDKVALTGIGMSQVGRRLMRPALSLTVDACLAAIAAAGLSLSDIDGLATYPGPTKAAGFSDGGIQPLEDVLGIYPTWICGVGHARTDGRVSQRHAGCGRGPLPTCSVLPHCLGVHGNRPGAGRERRRRPLTSEPIQGSGHPGLAVALRRHVGGQLDRHVGHALLP